MSTTQIAVVVGAAVVLLVIVVVLISKGRGGEQPEAEPRDETSMFDQPPSDTLERLGRPEQRPDAPRMPDESILAAPAMWDVSAEESELREAEPPLAEAEPAEAEQPEPGARPQPAEPEQEPGRREPVLEPAEDGTVGAGVEAEPAEPEAEPAPETEVAPAAAAGEPQGHLVPLSSIIVTTSPKMVDLDDPEVRRMLTDLVTFEIDQAAQFREQGQVIDAVLQLTEAEKICRALGKDDTAAEIRAMMRELQ